MLETRGEGGGEQEETREQGLVSGRLYTLLSRLSCEMGRSGVM